MTVESGPALASAPWSEEPLSVACRLQVDPALGLPPDEVRRRLAGGRNELPKPRPPTLFALVLEQLRETMILVLLGAMVLTAAVGDWPDSFIIALVVLLNTTLGVFQQRRAQRAIAALASLTAPVARALREGQTQLVPASEVVCGDIIEVAEGDLIPADGRLFEADALEVDESVLTGESFPVAKHPQGCAADSGVADRGCMLHAATTVTRGRGRVIVTGTGSGTEVGHLAGLLVDAVSPPTPLQVRLSRFGRQVAATTIALCLLVLAVGLAGGQEWGHMALTAVSLAVAAVPESLPAVLALSLAMSAQRMARRAAVVRTLPAVETLGAVTVIASDKTGTLTEGSMLASRLWTPAGPVAVDGEGYAPVGRLHGHDLAVAEVGPLLRAAVLCNDAGLMQQEGAWVAAGDPMEAALLALGAKDPRSSHLRHRPWQRLTAFAFDHERARMTTVHRTPDGQVVVVCKGAPEVVLRLVDEPLVQAAHDEVARMAAEGLRVLAVAATERPDIPGDAEEAERGLRLLGLIGLHDPPRAAAGAAIASCRAAGVVPMMITGDHPDTATAIATSLGILQPGDVVLTGDQLRAGVGSELYARARVFARTAPEQKLTIVEGLRAAGHVVAMTGDGVNDAPALRSADVGIAMGRSGTEVARQAADVVLVDDDFATIVAAVEEGRRVYDNVRRFLLYALSGGTAEILLMLLGPAFGLALPLLPAQILWVNMLTHGLPGVALGAEPAEHGTLDRGPRDPREGVLGRGLLVRILALGSVMAAAGLALGAFAASSGDHPWQTMIFVNLTLQQLGVAVALRSRRRSRARHSRNPLLAISLGLNLVLLALAVWWSPLAGVLDTAPLSLGETATCALVALIAPLGALVAGARVRG